MTTSAKPSLSSLPEERPTRVRYLVVSVATMMALILYLDRLFIGVAAENIRQDLHLTQAQMSWVLSAFFWAYALGQVPAGWFSDRFGARRMLTLYILGWSLLTGLLGMASAVWMVLYLRLFCGAAQAGAYPTAGGMIRKWIPLEGRGVASSIVALGGRAGGVLAPILTAWLIVVFSQDMDPTFRESDVVNEGDFLKAFIALPDDPRLPALNRVQSRLTSDLEGSLSEKLNVLKHEMALEKVQKTKSKKSASTFDWRDWVPGAHESTSLSPWASQVATQIAIELKDPKLFADLDLSRLKPDAEAIRLQSKVHSSPLTDKETVLMNRLILDSAFPKAIKQVRGSGWRLTVMAYCLAGVVIAFVFMTVVRDIPAAHPWCNRAEQQLIEVAPTDGPCTSKPRDPPFPFVAMLTNLSLWGNSLMQVFTNIGWLFVVTWFPRYLGEVHSIDPSGRAFMTAIPTAAGIFGMYSGGWWTDWATRRSGQKWGRRLPAMATRFSAGLGYAICLYLSFYVAPDPNKYWLPWAYVAALCLMAFSVDMGNPAVWAYAQDVGGKYTGSVLGWANMWGNLGAAVAPLIYNAVLGESPTPAHWTAMFSVCFLAFVVSGLCAVVIDSTKPLVKVAN